MMCSKVRLISALSALALVRVKGQSSCVQLTAANLSSCPCDQSSLAFTLEGTTTVAANTVNLALVLDGSGSIASSDFLLEKDFAKDAVAAFAARNLFDNGGIAGYVQYSSSVISSATFTSAQAFNTFVDADIQDRGGTNTATGITEGRALLAANAASASFMIVITDGVSSGSPGVAADAARADGTVVFAVGVGTGVNQVELNLIGGDPANVFNVNDFSLLDAALANILSSNGGSLIPCESTGVTVTVEFSVPVDPTSSSGASISGSTATFSANDIESNPTDFAVLLDLCSTAVRDSVIVSASYTDDQGNVPDLSLLTGAVVGNDLCAAPTAAPSTAPTPAPSPAPVSAPVKAPTKGPKEHGPPPNRPNRGPRRNGRKRLRVDSAKDATYLGCYRDDFRHPILNGPQSGSRSMTAQMCAGTCSSLGFEYFGTSSFSKCFCGDSRPSGRGRNGGVCDCPCSGDGSVACGGSDSMSVFKLDKYSGRPSHGCSRGGC